MLPIAVHPECSVRTVQGEIKLELSKMDVRVPLNSIGLAQLSLVDTVDFSELDVLLEQSAGGLLVVRSQCFTMSAPR